MMVNDQKKVMVENDSIEEKVEQKAQVKSEKKVEEKGKEVKKKSVKKVGEKTKKKVKKKTSAKTDKKKTEEDIMRDLLDEHFKKFEKGKIVEGKVVSVDERNVLVDIGFKSESAISVKEFSNSATPKVGDKIKVFIDSFEDQSGRLQLSKKKADFDINIDKLEKLQEANESIKGIYLKRVNGGMIVDILGIEAFLPGSLVSIKPIPNLDQFIGKESDFQIIQIDKKNRNIVLSRKKVLLKERASHLEELRGKIIVGEELDGEVRNITDYGAFIDLGGIDGLLHITDMSWGHIKHPSDMLNIGNKVRVKILNYNEKELKVSLGLKQLVPHPWENIIIKYPEGSNITGKVVNLTNYGAFVELEPGVEGLVHISEFSWTKKINHPKQMLKVGDTVKAIILTISKEEKRISLGIKQMDTNPWITIEQRYPVDTVLEGTVKTLTPFGVFIELEKDIEGLVHISDISWTKRIYHPREIMKKGQKVKVKILAIDKTLHRVALGIKQLENDPWENLDQKLPINTELKAKIVKIISKGVLVDIVLDNFIVEGFVPLSHLSIPGLKKADAAFKINEELPLKIIELDLENRRLILSVRAYFFAKDKAELQKYIKAHQDVVLEKQMKKEKIDEIISEKPKKMKETSKKSAKTDEDGKKKEITPAKKSAEKKEVKKTITKKTAEKIAKTKATKEKTTAKKSEKKTTTKKTTKKEKEKKEEK